MGRVNRKRIESERKQSGLMGHLLNLWTSYNREHTFGTPLNQSPKVFSDVFRSSFVGNNATNASYNALERLDYKLSNVARLCGALGSHTAGATVRVSLERPGGSKTMPGVHRP
jgi:hypothetical protein